MSSFKKQIKVSNNPYVSICLFIIAPSFIGNYSIIFAQNSENDFTHWLINLHSFSYWIQINKSEENKSHTIL